MNEITRIDISLVSEAEPEGRVLCYANVCLRGDLGEIRLCGIRLVQLSSKIILSFPSREVNRFCPCGGGVPYTAQFCCHCGLSLAPAEYREKIRLDVVHPLDSTTRKRFTDAVWNAYQERLKQI